MYQRAPPGGVVYRSSAVYQRGDLHQRQVIGALHVFLPGLGTGIRGVPPGGSEMEAPVALWGILRRVFPGTFHQGRSGNDSGNTSFI